MYPGSWDIQLRQKLIPWLSLQHELLLESYFAFSDGLSPIFLAMNRSSIWRITHVLWLSSVLKSTSTDQSHRLLKFIGPAKSLIPSFPPGLGCSLSSSSRQFFAPSCLLALSCSKRDTFLSSCSLIDWISPSHQSLPYHARPYKR